jgi:hypothetical protein
MARPYLGHSQYIAFLHVQIVSTLHLQTKVFGLAGNVSEEHKVVSACFMVLGLAKRKGH